jgi:arabinoxylan arabinofuranohydrolase
MTVVVSSLTACATHNGMDLNAKDGAPDKLFNNPIIANQGVCDPHIHIFNNKAYLFASHDDWFGNDFYAMYNWWVWSSPDLVNWTKEFTLLPEDMWVGATKNCWAVDGAERNGKHYFYVSGNWHTGVAVSANGPAGPYHDALGKALYTDYDPTVFIDDDENKTPYLVTSGFPYKIARLNEDMISLAEEPRPLIHATEGWEGDGGFLHKRNGIYYLNGHGTDYSTSTNVYGPYHYRGTFFPSWIDHPTIFNWHNQSYCAYGVGDGDQFFRATRMTYIHYKANGDIVADTQIANSSIGVGQYDSRNTIQAEWYFAASDGTSKEENASGFELRQLGNNSYLNYPNVRYVTANTPVKFRVSSANPGGGTIEIHEGSATGPLLGSCVVPHTGSWTTYQALTCTLINSAGTKNIYLVFKGTGAELMRLDSFDVGSLPDKASWVVSASHASSAIHNAIDGVNSTRWDTATHQTPEMWFKLDMGSIRSFNTVELDSTGSSNDGPVSYELYLSKDGVNWGSAIASGAGSAVTTITFPTQSAQYIKINQTGSSSSSYWSIHEINVYSSAGDTPPTPTAAPSLK